MNITEILVPPQEIAWLPWAVQYFFYIGSSYAAAILFVIALLFKAHTSHLFRSALVLVMAIGSIVGALALTGDLHQPGRAWHFYAHFTPWSWMSLGSLFLPLFSALCVLTAWLYLRNDIAKLQSNHNLLLRKLAFLSLGKWQISPKQLLTIASITALSGLTIALYTGAEIAVLASRQLWNQPASPLLWFITAFTAAIGLTLLMWSLFPAKQEKLTDCDARIIQSTASMSAILALILVPIWASNNTNFVLFQNTDWAVNLSSMTLSLLAVTLLATLTPKLLKLRRSALVLALACLTAAWMVRWITMMEVQTIPRFDAGAFPYHLPLGSTGLLGILGMVGLWLAMALFASEVVSAKPAKNDTPTHTNPQ